MLAYSPLPSAHRRHDQRCCHCDCFSLPAPLCAPPSSPFPFPPPHGLCLHFGVVPVSTVAGRGPFHSRSTPDPSSFQLSSRCEPHSCYTHALRWCKASRSECSTFAQPLNLSSLPLYFEGAPLRLLLVLASIVRFPSSFIPSPRATALSARSRCTIPTTILFG